MFKVELGSGRNFGSSMRIHSHFSSSSSSGSAPQVNDHFFGTQMGLSSSFGFPHPPAVLNQLDEEDDEGEQPKAVVRPVPKNAAAAKAKEPEAPAPNVVNKSKMPFKGAGNLLNKLINITFNILYCIIVYLQEPITPLLLFHDHDLLE
jgi:hypothetical protein